MNDKVKPVATGRTPRHVVTPGDDTELLAVVDTPANETPEARLAREQEEAKNAPRNLDSPLFHERVTYTPDGATIDLLYPFEVAGVGEVTELNIRRMRVQDRMAVDAEMRKQKVEGDAILELKLFARLADMTVNEIQALDQLDYATLQHAMRGFLTVRSVKKA